MGLMFLRIKNWIPLALAITLICGLIYLTVKQDLRGEAFDPQIQIAQDLKEDLNSGKKLGESTKNIDLNKSLAEFVIIFDEQNHPIYSEASLDGKIPIPPKGVFDYVLEHSQDRFTWQPKTAVRIAAVVTKFNKGFILAGRSLKEVEKREDSLLKQVEIGLGVILITTLVATLLGPKKI